MTRDVFHMKMLIIDDHALFRAGLSHILNELEENINILEASNYESAFKLVSDNSDLDLVLLDLNMPGKDGFSALDTFSKEYPAMPIVILSASIQQSNVRRALDTGAMGYIPKDTPSHVMLNALRLILDGGIYVPTCMAQQNNDELNLNNSNAHNLTPRQLEVLAMVVQGNSNKVIAARLELAEATVKMHVTAILKCFGVSNRTQAAMAAEKFGLNLSLA